MSDPVKSSDPMCGQCSDGKHGRCPEGPGRCCCARRLAGHEPSPADPVNSSDDTADVQRALSCCYGDEAGRLLLARFAAAVRAEAVTDPDAQPCTSCEGPTGNPDTFCDACKLDELEQECDRLRAKLAEAVADERRRIVKQVRAAKDEQVRAFGRDPGAYFAGRVDGLEDAARVVAAGSVPVATPEPGPRL